jgi:antitoxin FitA
MNILHVRNVPDDIYDRLKQLADANLRSLSAQVIEMLAQEINNEDLRLKQGELLASIRRRRFAPPENFPKSTELLHEDRQR